MRTKRTALTFKEAHIEADSGATFEDLLSRVGQNLQTVAARIFDVDLYSKIVVAEIATGSGRTFARLVELEEGAMGLLDLETDNASAQIETLSAPNKRRFVKAEAFVLAGGNKVVTVGFKNKAGTFLRALLDLAERCGINDDFRRTILQDVTNEAELQRIRRIGVKSVEFSITGYLADLDPNALAGLESNVLTRMFKRPMTSNDKRKTSKSRGRVVLTRGDIRSEAVSTDEWLDDVAAAAFQEADGYKIVLANDEVVKEQRLKVSSIVNIRTHANTLHAYETRLAMEQYWGELKARGLIE